MLGLLKYSLSVGLFNMHILFLLPSILIIIIIILIIIILIIIKMIVEWG